ncbi:cytochrome P450 [Actinomadura violacea]|uniref:Cytochrome P450 n=1 Tax=Actinomadura violacea TaxID=2819934 RepID=A0ABS3RZ12_9ACTN|nr:cytochrome P450 [Actinomadura violacea]MBO2462001.1 cytochrome P450 [Actinomadura violacea]
MRADAGTALRGEPVGWDEEQGLWQVTGFDEASAVLRGDGWSSDPRRLPFAPPELAEFPPGVLLFMDPPDHTRMRRLLSPAFTPRAVESLRPRVAEIVEAALTGLGDEADLLREVAYLVPVAVIAELLDVGEEGAGLLLDITPDLVRMLEIDAGSEDLVVSAAASAELMMFLTPLLAERRRRPGGDFISAMLAVPDGLTLDEIASTCVLLLAAGHETTANLIANSVLALLRDPSQRPHLLADPVRSVEELLRVEGPVRQVVRTALTDHRLGGRDVRAGEVVRVHLDEVGRGQGPLDLARGPLPHLAFGGGMHYCLGAALARMEAVETLPRLVARFPGMTLRSHEWRDSSTFHALTGLRVAGLMRGAD